MDERKMRENDAFWDIASLVPRKQRPTLSSFIPTPAAPMYEAEETESGEQHSGESRTLHFAETAGTAETYLPEGNPFLGSVSILRRTGGYDFYRLFLSDAVKYFSLWGTEMPYVPFFSYMPQYSQLSPQQSAYYLWWREQVKTGNFLRCDEGYFYLYVYEILNLTPSLIDPHDGILQLCRVWSAYHKEMPKINKFLSEWIIDYCLIFRLRCPQKELSGMMAAVLSQTAFREFYLGALAERTTESTETLLALLSDYNWHTSRYAAGDTAGAYAQHIPGSMYSVFEHLFERGDLSIGDGAESELERTAFCGALCAGGIKTALRVIYRPFSGATALRSNISAAVKYSENILRAKLGLKSRLNVPPLDEEYKRLIDAYYRVMYVREAPLKKTVTAPTPAYEALYDAPETGFDFTRADEIEALSWENTKRLIPEAELSESADEETVQPFPRIQENGAESTHDNNGCAEADATLSHGAADTFGLSEEAILFLCALESGAKPGEKFRGREDLLADQINVAFSERSTIGDIILENEGEGYVLIPDYAEEVQQWIAAIRRELPYPKEY